MTASSALALILTVALSSGAQPAPQGSTAGVAEGLFTRGRLLMEQGNYVEACPALEQSYRLDPAGGTILNLAVCYERAGRLASAFAHFQEALRTAKRDGRDDRAKIAQAQLDAIRPRLSTLEIRLPGQPAPNLVVELDRQPLPSAAFGVAAPIDGGQHELRARAPGHRAFEKVVAVPNEKGTLMVEIPALEPVAKAPVETPTPTPAMPTQAAAAKRPNDCIDGFEWDGFGCSPVPTETRVSNRLWGWVGVTGAFLSVGTITGVAALGENNDSTEQVRRDNDDEAKAAENRMLGWAWASTGAFAFAGLFAIVGLSNAFEEVPIAQGDRAHLYIDGEQLGIRGTF